MLFLNKLSLTSTSIILYLVGFTLLVIAIVYILRFFFLRQRAKILSQNLEQENKIKFSTSRVKYSAVNVFSYRTSFLSFGMLLALSIALVSLSWTNYSTDKIISDVDMIMIDDVEIIPPRTVERPPPLPKLPIIIEIPNDEIIDDQPELIDQSIEASEIVEPVIAESKTNELIRPTIEIEDEIDVPFRIVEEMPRYPGCENSGSKKDKTICATKSLLSFIYSNIKYPSLARENGIEGTAVIQFVIEKNGSVSNILTARDIGAGCGNEAKRVVTLMQKENIKWTPGKQRGRAVRVMFTLPIKFKLE